MAFGICSVVSVTYFAVLVPGVSELSEVFGLYSVASVAHFSVAKQAQMVLEPWFVV